MNLFRCSNSINPTARVSPLLKDNFPNLYALMENYCTLEHMCIEDFDLSFIKQYEKHFLAARNARLKFDDQRLGILQIFSESEQTRSLRKIIKFIDNLMEKYGLIFLSSVVDNHFRDTSSKPYEQNPAKSHKKSYKKTIVFIDDPPLDPESISWMGRMLAVSLLSHGFLPLVIPWNDFDSPNMYGALKELAVLSPHRNTQEAHSNFTWVLKKGFSLALTSSHNNIIIVDADWNGTKIHELIAQADDFPYELIFMKNHAELNRTNFVLRVLDKIKESGIAEPCARLSEQRKQIIVDVVKPQSYISKSNSNQPGHIVQNLKSGKESEEAVKNTHKYNLTGDISEHDDENVNSLEGLSLDQEIKFLESGNNFKPTETEKVSKSRLLRRFFGNIKDKSSSDCSKGKKKKFLFNLPKIFSISSEKSLIDKETFDQYEEQLNPNIMPRLTDEQFDRRLIQPKIYARTTQMQEAEIFCHSKRDTDDLETIFLNCTQP